LFDGLCLELRHLTAYCFQPDVKVVYCWRPPSQPPSLPPPPTLPPSPASPPALPLPLFSPPLTVDAKNNMSTIESPKWAVQTGGTGPVLGFGIEYDGVGGALVSGYFSGQASFGSTSLTSRGTEDAFVMHVTASGAIDWAVQAGGASQDQGYGIAHDGVGGALVTGYFSGQASFGSTSLTSRGSTDAYVMHVTASGAIDWAVQAGGASQDQGYGIAHDGAGGALVTGYFSGQASFGSTSLTSRGTEDAFVMHVTASGAIDWAVQAGGASQDQGYGIAHDGAGGALVTGYFSGNASFGSTSLTSRGTENAFVMHVTASGAIDWAVQAGGVSQDQGYGIAHDGVGGALVTGYFKGKISFGSTSLTSRGSTDAFVMHVTASGAIDWAVQAGGESVTESNGIAHDGVGGALVTGYFKGKISFGSTSLTSRGSTDTFVMHVTASGAIDWAVQTGSSSGGSSAQPRALAHDGVGGYLVTGYFTGNASFGSTMLTSLGSAATCFVASLMPPPDRPQLHPRPPPASAPLHPPPPGSPLKSSLSPDPRGMMDLIKQPEVAVPALATSLALLVLLLLACVYRRHYRRLADNFRASLDRRELDMQLLEHRAKQQAPWNVCSPSECAPNSIPPGPPSSIGSSSLLGSDGGGAGSDAGSSMGGWGRGSSRAGSEVASDAVATSLARDGGGGGEGGGGPAIEPEPNRVQYAVTRPAAVEDFPVLEDLPRPRKATSLSDVSESYALSATGLFTESSNLEGSPWHVPLDIMNIASSAQLESIAEEDERMGAPPQPYADGTMHRPGELEGSSDHHGMTPMPSRRASGDHAPTPSHADADEGDGEGSDEGDGEGSDEGECMGGLVLRHDGRDGGREGGAPFDGHDAFAIFIDGEEDDRIKHRPGELEGSSDLHGIMPMPSRRANGDHAPTPSHADADEGDSEGSDEGERMGGLALRHDGRDGGREGGAPFDGHDAFATSLDRIKHPPVDRLSEILGFIQRKERWEIKPEDAKLLLVSKLEGGAAVQVPSQKYAKWVSKSEPHVFFVESDTQDAGDIEESDRQVITTSGARSHTVTQFDDFIAVTRASSSSGKDSPYPKKVGQFHLALLEGHPDYGSDVFRDIQLKEAKEIGREKIWGRIFGPKLVHSVPYMNKRRRVDAGSSSAEIVDGRTPESEPSPP